jgi:hypothetical protein
MASNIPSNNGSANIPSNNGSANIPSNNGSATIPSNNGSANASGSASPAARTAPDASTSRTAPDVSTADFEAELADMQAELLHGALPPMFPWSFILSIQPQSLAPTAIPSTNRNP